MNRKLTYTPEELVELLRSYASLTIPQRLELERTAALQAPIEIPWGAGAAPTDTELFRAAEAYEERMRRMREQDNVDALIGE